MSPMNLFLLFFSVSMAWSQSIRPVAINNAEPTPFIPNGVTDFGVVIINPGDLDADGLPNSYETQHGLDPADPSDALLDGDGDGLLNLEEFQLGTDPTNPDTDGDGFTDLEEVVAGTDPLDNTSVPSEPPVIPVLAALEVTPPVDTITVNSVLGTVPLQLTVTAVFNDGTRQNVTDDFRTHYQTGNPGVAGVTDSGALFGISGGSTVITVTRHPLSVAIPVDVNLFLPQIIGKTNLSGVNGVAIQSDVLYLARDAGFDLYDVSQPANPLLITSVDPGSHALDVEVLGNQAWVAISGVGVKTYDLSSSPPIEQSLLDLPGVKALELDGNHLVAAATDRVVLVDVFDPTLPQPLQTINQPADRVAADQGFVYTLYQGQITAYAMEPQPIQLSRIPSENARDLTANGGVLYLGTSSGLSTVDVSDPTDPVVIGSMVNRFNSFGIAYTNQHVFLAENLFVNVVPIANVFDPANPILAANPQINDDADGHDISVDGSLAALASNEGFQLVRWFIDSFGNPPAILDLSVNPTTLVGGGHVDIAVSAADDVAVAAIELLVDNVVVRRQPDSSANFRLSTPLVPATTTRDVHVRVIDGAGVATQSPIQTITLQPDTQAPMVSILTPLDGAMVTPGFVAIHAAAQDNIGIDRVELYLDGVLIETRISEPYHFTPLVPVPPAERPLNIRVTAVDISGNSASDEINVIIPSVAELIIQPDFGILVGMNSQLPLHITGLLTDGVSLVDLTNEPGTTYVSSDPNVATVSGQGTIEALSNGDIQVTVSNGGAGSTADFQVYALPPDPDDVTPPQTAVNGLAANQTSARFDVEYNLLSGAHDFAGVRLFYRFNLQGDFIMYRPEENQSGIFYGPAVPFDTLQTGGDGLYEFYTSARDINGNLEPAPASFAETLVDTNQPVLEIPDGTFIAAGDLTYDFRRVRIDGGAVIMNGEHRFIAMEIINGGTLTHQISDTTQTHHLSIRTGLLEIDAISRIDVTDKGYLGSHREDNNISFARTLGNVPTTAINAGGSYGGLGGNGNSGLRVPSYGDFRNPMVPGTGGSANGSSGNGGGVIRIDASLLNLDGELIADGGSVGSRAGSGGSILVHADVLAGNGSIRALGGDRSIDGGGGRIAVYTDNMDGFDRSAIQAHGASDSNTDESGGAGTVYIQTPDWNELIIDNNGIQTSGITTLLPSVNPGFSSMLTGQVLTDQTADFPVPEPATGAPGLVGQRLNPNTEQDNSFLIVANTATTITVAGDMTGVAVAGDPYSGITSLDRLTLAGRAQTTFGSNRILAGDRVNILSESILTIPQATTSLVHKLDLVAAVVHIDATSAIDTTGKGFLGSNRGNNANSLARTIGNRLTTIPNAGGSYGGLGGNGNGGFRVPGYGGFRIPNLPGTGGSESGSGGNGGGVALIRADRLEVEGAIRADGDSVGTRGGSGGSVLIRTDVLTGNGFITANGGDRAIDGGGGRIALYSDDTDGFDTERIQTYGPPDSNIAEAGGAGTIYLESSSSSRLIIDNNNHVTSGITTVLRSVGRGKITSLTADTLTDDAANFPVPDSQTGEPGLAGLRLVPHTGRDASFEIIDNTATTIRVAGDLTGVAEPGDTYSGAIMVDEIFLEREARVTLGSDRMVVPNRLELLENSVLTLPLASTVLVHQLDVDAGTVHIDSGSAIDCTGKGFLGSFRQDNNIAFGRTLGNVPGTIPNAGGSYGGLGGNGNGGLRNPSYGDFRAPQLPGSGGSENGVGSNGGGVIRLKTDTLQVDGAIRVDGEALATRAGSGGSILIQTDSLLGTGLITANGGQDSIDGGGGRIAIHSDDTAGFEITNIQAHGGNDDNTDETGGAGTVYIETSTEEHLIIDNNNHVSSSITTLLRSLGRGWITALTADTLTDDTANFPIPDPDTGEPGLIGLRLIPDTEQDVSFEIIDNTATTITVVGDLTAIAAPGDRYSGATRLDRLTLQGESRVSFGSDRIIVPNNLNIIENSLLTTPLATTDLVHQLDVQAGTVDIQSGSAIDVTGKGFLGSNREDNNNSFGRTIGNVLSSIPNAGGSYGGLGGNGNGGLRNPSYGDFRMPQLPGSGGSASGSSGNGGGIVRLKTGVMNVDGAVRADGEAAGTRSGSGGSILIQTGTLAGLGLITANGGDDSIDGGGGRIAIHSDDTAGFQLANIQAHGGDDGNSDETGGAGTIYFETSAEERLIIDNNNHSTSHITTVLRSLGRGRITALTSTVLTDDTADFPVPNSHTGEPGLIGLLLIPETGQDTAFEIIDNTATTITVSGDLTTVAAPGDSYSGATRLDRLTLQGESRVTFGSDRVMLPNRLDLREDSVLTIPFASTTLVHQLELHAGAVSIENGSAIDVTGKGFLGSNRQDNNHSFGRTIGNVVTSIPNAGGSYGGLGGNGNGGLRNASYGDFRLPRLPGSGGSEAGSGGNGGGIIHLKTDTLQVDGSILANGGPTSTRGGSGGSILIHTGSLAGAGSISATGGSTAIDGGGGRIAIYSDDTTGFDRERIHIFGGPDSNTSEAGGAGTLFIKSSLQQHGELIVNNDGAQTNVDSTILRSVGTGISTALSGNTLTNTGASFPVPDAQSGALGLVGLELNPNRDQNQTFTIVDNSPTQITVDGDMTAVAVVGDEYTGIIFLDALTVEGEARLHADDLIILTEGGLFMDQAGLNAAEIAGNGGLRVNLSDSDATFATDQDWTFDRFQMNNSTLTLIGNGTLTGNHMTLVNSILTVDDPSMDSVSALKLDLTGLLTVDGNSLITTTGKGYLGGLRADNPDIYGITLEFQPGSEARHGGSHGGMGGSTNPDEISTNSVYGNLMQPAHPGSGGGAANGQPGGNGGGVIDIRAADLMLDGQIRADGGGADRGAPGSGGSITISLAGALAGYGSISAMGGDHAGMVSTGGGGGRIALSFDDNSGFTGSVRADGGMGRPAGGAGTLLTRSGDMTVLTAAATSHSVIHEGTALELDTDVLTLSEPRFDSRELVGKYLSLRDQPRDYYPIIDNRSDQIRVAVPKGSGLSVSQLEDPTFLILDPHPAVSPKTHVISASGILTGVGERVLVDETANWQPDSLNGLWATFPGDHAFPITGNDRQSIRLDIGEHKLSELVEPGESYATMLALNRLVVSEGTQLSYNGKLRLHAPIDEEPLEVAGRVDGSILECSGTMPVRLLGGGTLVLDQLQAIDTPEFHVDGSGLILTGEPSTAIELYVTNGGWITTSPEPDGPIMPLRLETQLLAVDAPSRIHVNGKGHDGNGGNLQIHAETIRIDGLLEANGQAGNDANPAGAGGSILLRAATLLGDGAITANGGSVNQNGPPGDGGQIRLDVKTNHFDRSRITSTPGKSHKETRNSKVVEGEWK